MPWEWVFFEVHILYIFLFFDTIFMTNKWQLPTEYDRHKIEKEVFANEQEEMDYNESMVDIYYDLKPEYQKIFDVYRDYDEYLKIESFMIEEKNQKDMSFDDDLPF